MSDLQIQGEVVVSSEKAEAAFDRVGDKAERMASDVAKSANEAGKAVDGIGGGAEKSAEKFTRAEARMRDAIQKSTRELQMLGKTASQKFEAQLDFKGLDRSKFEPFLADLRKMEEATGRAQNKFLGLGDSAAMLGRAFAALGIVGVATQFVKIADEATSVNSRLKLVTASTQELSTAQAELFRIAQNSRVSYAGLADTFSQMSRATKELGVSQRDMLAIAQTISRAVTISGGSAQAAQAALVQLSQGFASGTLRGEELNSVLEQTPRLAQAIAQGLGVTIGQLRAMGQAGELTGEAVLGALQKAASSVDADFGQMAVTVEQASTTAANSVLRLVGAFDQLTGTTSLAGGAIQSISKGIDALTSDLEKLGSQGPIRDAAREVIDLDAAAKRLRTGMDSGVFGPNAQAELDRINARLAEAKQRFRELDQQLGGTPDPRDQSNFKPRGASYQDYARQQADSEKALIEVRMRAAGVNKQYLADLKTYQDALKLGTMDHAQYIKAVSDLATTTYKSSAAGKEAEKGLKSGASEAKKAANEYQRLIDSINTKIAAEELELAGGEKLTDSQRLRVQFAQELQTSLKGLSAAKVAEYTADLNRLESLERENNARKEFLQIAEQERQQRLKIAQAAEQSVDSLATGNQQLRDEIQLIGLSAAEQIEVIRLREEAVLLVKEQHLAEMARAEDLTGTMTRERIALEQEIELRRERLNLMGDKATKEQFAESNREMNREWQRTVDQYGDVFRQGFADMLNNGKDGWKSFTRSLVTTFKTTVADQIYKMFAQPFVVNIVGNLLGVTGGGAGNAAMQIASGGSGSGVLGMGSNIASIFGAGGIGGSLMAGAGWLTGATTLGGSLTAGASLLGTGTLAGGAAGLGMIAGAIAPIALAAAALGNVFGLFRKTEKRGYGLMGTLGEEDGVHSLDLMRKGGSLLGGPKWFVRDTGVSEMDKALQDTYKQQRDALMKMGEALGLATDHVKDFTVQLGSDELGDKKVRGIRLDGLSDEEAQKKIAEALATANNEIAQQIIGTWERTVREVERIDISRPTDVGDTTDYGVPNVIRESIVDERYIPSEFARDGEKAIDTLTRLATSITGVNSVFENMGVTLYEASLAGGDMASQLVDLFGGLDKFGQATGTYMQNFYSADEQRDVVRRQLQRAFEGLDLTMPDIDASDARAQFRALAEAQDRSTEEGRKTWAMLMQLSGAFAGVTEAAESAAQAAERLSEEQQRSAYDMFRRAVDRDRDLLQDQASAISDVIGNISSAVGMLKSNARELYGTVDSTAQMQAAQGMVYIENALAGVRAGASVADYTGLGDAIGAARSGISNGAYTSQFERERDALVLAGQLSEMGDLGELQLSIEERQLKAINEQLEYLDRLSKLADDAVNGTAALTETVQTYFDRLMSFLDPEKPEGGDARRASFAGVGGGGGGFGGGGAPNLGGSEDARDAAVRAIVGGQLQYGADKGLGHDDTQVLAAINAARYGLGITQADIARAYGVPVDDIERLFAGAGIPKFDVGTNYIQRTGLAVVHEGEAIVPKAFNPWAGGQGMQGGNERLERLVEALTAQNARLEARLAAIEGHAKKQADQFESYSNGGTFSRQKALA